MMKLVYLHAASINDFASEKHPSAFYFTVFLLSLQLKSFHNELLSELEKKVELDARYLTVSI